VAHFPVLKTGAIAQYPSDRGRERSTLVLEFMDGSEQRSALYGSSLRRWTIRLDFLDEAEMFRLEEFWLHQGGAAGRFTFTDPWDGVQYPSCSFEGDSVTVALADAGRGGLELMIKENR